MVDFTSPVTFYVNDKVVTLDIEPDGDILASSLASTGDPELMWAAEVSYEELVNSD